jgi:hypothetical protein
MPNCARITRNPFSACWHTPDLIRVKRSQAKFNAMVPAEIPKPFGKQDNKIPVGENMYAAMSDEERKTCSPNQPLFLTFEVAKKPGSKTFAPVGPPIIEYGPALLDPDHKVPGAVNYDEIPTIYATPKNQSSGIKGNGNTHHFGTMASYKPNPGMPIVNGMPVVPESLKRDYKIEYMFPRRTNPTDLLSTPEMGIGFLKEMENTGLLSDPTGSRENSP